MDYYTNVISYGNSILIRGVNNGERITARNKFQPTLFVPVQKETQYKSPAVFVIHSARSSGRSDMTPQLAI